MPQEHEETKRYFSRHIFCDACGLLGQQSESRKFQLDKMYSTGFQASRGGKAKGYERF